MNPATDLPMFLVPSSPFRPSIGALAVLPLDTEDVEGRQHDGKEDEVCVASVMRGGRGELHTYHIHMCGVSVNSVRIMSLCMIMFGFGDSDGSTSLDKYIKHMNRKIKHHQMC
jgi:hypothetical protein